VLQLEYGRNSMSDGYSSEDFEQETPRASQPQPAPAQQPQQSQKSDRPPAAPANSTQRPSSTPHHQAVLKELMKENAQLRRLLSSVNSELDEHLSRKGQKMGYRPPASGSKHVSVVEQRRMMNDKLRKRNQVIESELDKKDLPRYRELRNQIGEMNRNIEIIKDENLSLENVYANQRQKLADIDKIELEMKNARSEHDQALREIKDQMREAKELREANGSEMHRLRRHLEKVEQKIKVQDSVGSAVKTVAELQELVAEKDRTIESLKYQVAVLSRTNVSDKKRSKARHLKISQQIQLLQEELDDLRERAKARGLADELGIDRR
jgi:hypothetical protein